MKSFSSPDAPADGADSVRRRRVFFIPGYDPEAKTRYRLLFVRELTRYSKILGEPKREIGRAGVIADGLVQSWQVGSHAASGGAATRYDVLLWDDIVLRDFKRFRLISIFWLILGTVHAVARGKLVTFYRLNWKYGNVILYPFVILMVLAAAAIVLAYGVARLLENGVGLPVWASIPAGIAAALGLIWAGEAALNRMFFWQLLNDWVFNWQHGSGWRPDYARRVDRFVDYIAAEIGGGEVRDDVVRDDEIMIVGHSTGGLTAVEVAARLLARDPELGRHGPALSLVTLGSAMPLVAIQPRAKRVRSDIASLVISERIVWADYFAPQDWMNFPGFEPVRELKLALDGAPALNPLVRSAKFREIVDPATYAKIVMKPFRMHFQFLMSNDRRGEYDFFAMVLGPRRLAEWVAGAPARAPTDA